MNRYVLSEAADADIERIARPSITRWGLPARNATPCSFTRPFETLGEFRHLGRDAGRLRSGYFRFEHGSHSVFYQKTNGGIIVRVLHQKQQPENYL